MVAAREGGGRGGTAGGSRLCARARSPSAVRALRIEPTRFWVDDDLQEALLVVDSPGRCEIRSAVGAVTVDVRSVESIVAVPSLPGVDRVEVTPDMGEPATFPWSPGVRWDIVVMPTGHVDVYSTDTFDKTPAEHVAMIDAAIDLCAELEDFHYQIENLLPVAEYCALQSERYDDLVDLVRAGRIGVGAQQTGIHHGEVSGEELVLAHLALGRRLGVAPNCGYTCDVPAATAQYRQLLARLGIPRWIYSPNRFPAPGGFYGVDALLRRLPTYGRAVAPDGTVVEAWIPPVQYGTDPGRFGLTAGGVDAMRSALDARLAALEASDFAGSTYVMEASAGDNLPPSRPMAALVADWSVRYAWPQVRFGTALEAFDAIQSAGIRLPRWSGEIADTWAWIVANQASLNGAVRDGVRGAVGAAAAAVVSGCDWPIAVDDALDAAAAFASHDWWYAGEHTMGIPDLAKAEFARRCVDGARRGERAAAESAGDGGVRGAEPADRLFDTTGAARRALVVSHEGGGQLVPQELVAPHFGATPWRIAFDGGALRTEGRAGTSGSPGVPESTVVVSVRDVGAYEVVAPTAGVPTPSEPCRPSFEVESRAYRVTLGEEGIVSLVDRALGVDLLGGPVRLRVATPQWESAGIGFTGDKAGAQDKLRSSLAEWEDTSWAPVGAWRGDVFAGALWRGAVRDSPANLAVVAYDAMPRVDVTFTVDWDGMPRSARFFAEFPFDVGDLRETRYEVPFGSVVAGSEAPVGPATLRMINRWVSFTGSAASVVVASRDVPVVALGDPARTLADLAAPDRPARATAAFVLADTGAASPLVQPGRLVARFSVMSARKPTPPSAATRFAAGACEPLRPALLPAAAAHAGAGWHVSPANVVLSGLKPAWDGDGVVVRVVECDGAHSDVEVLPPFAVAEVEEVRPDETPMGRVELPLWVRPYEIRTLRFRPSGEAPR